MSKYLPTLFGCLFLALGLLSISPTHGQVEVIKGTAAVDYSSPDWEQQKFKQDREVERYNRKMLEEKIKAGQAKARRLAEAQAEEKAEAQRLAQKRERARRRDDEEGRNTSHLTNSTPNSRGAVNPVTGEFYAPAGGGNLVGTRDGTLFTPAGPSGYINSRTGQFVPAH